MMGNTLIFICANRYAIDGHHIRVIMVYTLITNHIFLAG